MTLPSIKQHLQFLRVTLQKVDDDPQKSLFFFQNSKEKLVLIDQTLHIAEHNITGEKNCDIVDDRMIELRKIIDDKYQIYHHFQWPCHSDHFHPHFKHYVNCPTTCCYELIEFFEKIEKELYNG